ncbi:MAG: hypothetical protein LBM08_12900 [Dysgonamonadaceae bacterium]|jgi:hypothetical protein|nr:hypothetical protein [Dysgonamonadaceae bacterium]
MKSILRSQRNKIYNFAMVLVSLIALGIFVQSCSKENDYLDKSTYLDINTSTNQMFTTYELNILSEAFQRIDKHVAFVNNEYVITIQSGKDINVSDKLFSILKRSIKQLNYQSANRDFFVSHGMVVNDFNESIPRLKSSTEITYGLGYYQTQTIMTHNEAIKLMNTMQTVYSHASFWGALIAAGITNPLASTLVAAWGYLSGLQWGSMETNYLNGPQTGMTLYETTFTGSSLPGYTVYSTSY